MTRQERKIVASNPFIFTCSECGKEIPVDSFEEMLHAVNIKGLCENCADKPEGKG
jgi:hypothetical protein